MYFERTSECCGLMELAHFDGLGKNTQWMDHLVTALEYSREGEFEYGRMGFAPHLNLVLFTKNNLQKGQDHFVKWLRKQGETVAVSGKVRSDNTGRSLTGYIWPMSKKFKRKLKASYFKRMAELEREEESQW